MKALMIALMLGSTITPLAAQEVTLEEWPPREYLVRAIVDDIPGILNSYHPETGRFGTEPWICGDQNVIFTLAVAWSLEHPENPFYHSDEVLQAIAGGGVALVEAQDSAGRWRFDKKDGSYWGQIHMPWTYSRWIRAYDLVGEALPAEARETWERGLLLGFGEIARPYPDTGVHNIPTHHAMGLYIAGECFGNEDWKQRAREFMPKVVATQDPGGFWSEHSGPVIGYNYVYSEALGIYYAYAQDPVVLEALRRAALFHASVLFPNGSAMPSIDERQIYSAGINPGNPGFAHTPEGRGYLLSQLRRFAGEEMALINAELAASLLLYSSDGEVVMPEDIGEEGVAILGDNDALIRRGEAWSWGFSAYTAEVPDNRWIQDRHNLVDLFHEDLGLVAGGGNTKLQPYWSTFTVGDPSLLHHTPGDQNPNFTPEIALRWTADEAAVSRDGDLTRLDATIIPRVPAEREALLTGGFEDTAEGALPEGWTVDFGRPEQMRVTADAAHEGERALWIADASDAQSVGLRSPKVQVEQGDECFVEVSWLGEAENNAAVYLEFWTDEGRIEGEGVRSWQLNGQGDWVTGGGTMRAPEGAVAMTALLYSGSSTIAQGYFDDVRVGRLVRDEREIAPVQCSVEARPDGNALLLTYRAEQGRQAEAHLPLMLKGSRVELADGRNVMLLDELVTIPTEEIGGYFIHGDLRVEVPEGVSLRWPALHHNPYAIDGASSLNNAKLVVVMPFADTDEYTLRLSRVERAPFEGLAFEARDLPFTSSEGTYTKRLDSLGSQFVGSTQVGSWLRFELPEIAPGRYELLGDFVLADSYGIVEVLLDDEVVGEPFDGYWTAVDASGTIQSFGEVELGAGAHTVAIRIIDKNPKATNTIFSVKRWLLRPVG